MSLSRPVLAPLSPGEVITPLHLLAVRSDGLSFRDCVVQALDTPELIREFDRLKGTSLAGAPTPLARMIDDASGKTVDDMGQFLAFVWDAVFCRV